MFIPNIRLVMFDITYRCNLSCTNCNRGCDTLVSGDSWDMTPKEIEERLRESIKAGFRIDRLEIIGGEPTIHPNFKEIVDIFLWFHKKTGTRLQLFSNGNGEFVQKQVEWLRTIPIINTVCTAKPSSYQPTHYNVRQAPVDTHPELGQDHQYQGCSYASNCGIVVNKKGIYPCCAAPFIDRVFKVEGFFSSFSEVTEQKVIEMYNKYCRYCGMYKMESSQVRPSKSWRLSLQQHPDANRKCRAMCQDP